MAATALDPAAVALVVLDAAVLLVGDGDADGVAGNVWKWIFEPLMLLASRTRANGLSPESMTILFLLALRMPVSVVRLSRVEVDFVFWSNC